MCRSKAEGGRRCPQTDFKKGKRALRDSPEHLSLFEHAHEQYGDNIHPLEMLLPQDVEALLDTLQTTANPLIVGGSVRDALYGDVEPKDIDIELHGASSYRSVTRHLREQGYTVNEVGKEFGVIKTILPDGTDIDISLPRRENRIGAGHRDFNVSIDTDMSLAEAAERRDFTMNAMYYDHAKKTVIDPYQGRRDLQAGILKHVGDAYSEDPLRVLRGVQMAARYNLSMHSDTTALSQSLKSEFSSLSVERVYTEWGKLFSKGQNITHGLDVLHDTGWNEPMGFTLPVSERVAVAQAVMDARAHHGDPHIAGAARILKNTPEDRRRTVATRLLATNKARTVAMHLASHDYEPPQTTRETRILARALGDECKTGITQWAVFSGNVERTRELAEETGHWSAITSDGKPARTPQDHVTAHMLLDASEARPGKWVGQMLKRARDAEDQELIHDARTARAWVAENL